jgi:opacity protein-like surface antigen
MPARHHRISILAALFFGAAVSNGHAQSLFSWRPPVFPLTAPGSNWTGAYVAASAGLSRQTHETNMALPGNASQDAGPAPYPTTSYWLQQDISGVNATGQMLNRLNKATFVPSIGYDVQFGMFLAGAEASYNFLTSNSINSAHAAYNSGGTYTIEQRGTVDGLFRGGGRFGFVFDNVLIYGKGGFARGRLNYSYALNDSFGHVETAERQAWSNGWYAGGGVEFRVSRALSLRLEVTHTDLKALNVSGGAANQLSVNYFNANYHFQETAALFGLVLRLN